MQTVRLCVCVCVFIWWCRQGKLIRKVKISLVVGGSCQLPYHTTTMALVQAGLDTVPADSLKLD